jgi:hypothetical protein
MPIDDVWRDISKYINIYTSKNFDDVPSKPGVYAWFYPIELPSMNIGDLAVELSSILNYDSKLKDEPCNKEVIPFNWKDTEVRIKEIPHSRFSDATHKKWDNMSKDKKSLLHFRKIMLVSSILMPPLYVGKTNNLLRRCNEHRNSGEDKNGFHNRFEEYTKNKKLVNGREFNSKTVEDLIFVCIKTDLNESHEILEKDENFFSELLEEILKVIAKPPYGEK